MSEYKEVTIDDVISVMKKNQRRCDTKLIMKAYEYAKSNHGDQLRMSGEPYIIHPMNVAYILADLGMDDEPTELSYDLDRGTPALWNIF